MTGRNEPCPCGSGKKYKKCCAQSVVVNGGASQASFLDQAIQNFENGDFPGAVSAARTYLKSNRHEPMCWQVLGVSLYYLGDFTAAEDAFREVVKRDKQNPDAWNNLGLVLYEQSLFDEAKSSCLRALKLQPAMAGALNNLGNVYQAQADFKAAEKHFSAAIKSGLKTPEVYCNLGTVRFEMGDYLAAKDAYTKALEIDPDSMEALSNLGALLLESGDDQSALPILERAHQLAPMDVDVICNLAKYWLAQDKFEPAEELLNDALSQQPDEAAFYSQLGSLYRAKGLSEKAVEYLIQSAEKGHLQSLVELAELRSEQGRAKEAEDYYLAAIKQVGKSDLHLIRSYCEYLLSQLRFNEVLAILKSFDEQYSGRKEILLIKAEYYTTKGHYDDAATIYRQLLDEYPTNIAIMIDLALLEESRHHLQEAEELAKRIRAIDPEHAQAGLILVKALVRQKQYSEALLAIDELNSANNLNLRSSILYERIAILDHLQRYSEAFLDLLETTKLKNKLFGEGYKSEREQQYFQHVCDVVNKNNMQNLRFEFNANEKITLMPIFIVGFPRSGTTLVEQILSAHSDVSAGDEMPFIDELKNKISPLTGSNKAYPDNLVDQTHPLHKNCIIKLRDYYFSRVNEKEVLEEGNQVFTDKLPHNLQNLGLITLLFPEAPIIHITRHPLDACLSASMANFEYGRGHGYTSSMENTAKHYSNLMQLAEHYKAELDMNYLQIRYEDIVADPETKIRELIEFVGLPWQDACLDFHQTKRVSTTASYAQVTQKIYTSSRFRYKNYFEQMTPYAEILTEAMNRFGYTFEP